MSQIQITLKMKNICCRFIVGFFELGLQRYLVFKVLSGHDFLTNKCEFNVIPL